MPMPGYPPPADGSAPSAPAAPGYPFTQGPPTYSSNA